MTKKLYLAIWFVLVQVFVRKTRTFTSDGEASWFVGCYNDSNIFQHSSFEPSHFVDHVTPFSCIRWCTFNESFKYAAVKNGSSCFCLSQVEEKNRLNDAFCNLSCHKSKNITCGGTNSSSVYSTAVPLIVALNLSLPNQVKANASVAAISELSIKRWSNEVSGLNRIREGNQTADSFSIQWFSERKVFNTILHTLKGNTTRTSSHLEFIVPGHHNVCVQARNLFSKLERCMFVDVVAPVKGLQLVAVFSERTKLELLPSLLIPTVKTVHLKYLIMSGSRPEFTFDFGDGSSLLTVAKAVSGRIALECSCVTVSHVFQRCGNITINATASNSISRESVVQPAMVNVFIQSLEIDKGGRKDCIYVEVNVPKTLRTKIRGSKGCIVSYEWNFNDSSPNVITQDPTVSHTFSTLRRYYVTVIAHNEHGRKEAVAEVCVQERLKGVVLEPEVSQLIISTDEDTKKFHAKLRPELPGFGTVRFSFYRSDRNYPLTPGPGFPFYHNEKAGRYIVFAEAANKVSRISSNRIEVFVLDPIIKLSIHHDPEGTVLRGKLTHLVARLGKGTNVTYYWDFGDGSQENTTSADVYHTFTRRDKFEVRVTASNAVSSEDAFMHIFVTDLPHCYPPEVSMIGNRERVNRSQEIRLEAYVTLNNCSKTKEVLYSWKVRNLSRRKPVQLDDVSFTEQVLILPPCMLEYGNHLVHLEVKVKGTVLSAGIKKYIKIVKSHLVAIIAGGTTKVVGRKNKRITMNASSSYDPDYPDEGHQNLRFRWSCHPLGRKDISCFNQTKLSGLNMSSAILTFQLDWLLADITHQFEVVVFKDSRNFSSFQIIYVHTERPHLLSANCPQCDKGHVNPSFPLVVTGLCLSCPLINSNVTYKWRLYHVGDTKLLKEEDCPLTEPALDDSSVNLNSVFKSTRKTLPTFPPTNSLMPATTRSEVTPTQQLTSKKETDYTTKPTATTFSRARFSSGLICQDPDQILGPTTSPPRKHPFWPGGGPGSGSGSGGGTGHGSGSGTGSGSGSGSGSGTGTGTGSGTGSSSGVRPKFNSQQKTTTIPPTQAHLNSTTVAPTTDDDDDDDAVVPPLETIMSPTYMPPSAKYLSSIISLDRRQLKLSAKQTTTGLGRQNFVLQGTFLRGGHTYMVSFKVFDGNTGQQGKASVFFNTSHILRCGVCSVTPDSGVAMETNFQLTCSRWLGNKPYTYNVRYSISGEGERFFVYSGFKDKVPFVLPAGLPLFSNTVQIYVTVADGQGSRRRIQPVRVEVKPQVVPEGIIMEEILLNQTVGNKLSLLQEARNEQGIQQFITALAISLNRLGSVRNVTSKFYLRVQIREKLLQGIQNLTVYDRNSALQTCLALQTLTKKPDELSVISVETASKTLHKLGEMMKLKRKEVQDDWTVARELLSQEFIQSATRVTSNLLEASSLLVQRNSTMNKGNMLLRATEAAEELIKAKLSMQVLGEQSLQVTTQNIRVIATQRSSVSDFLFSIGDFKFHMPTNLEKQLNIASAANKGSCFGTMMTVYQENPFFSNMLHTTVGSLSISRCSGEEIQVKNLSSDILISIPHKNYWVEQHAENFTLKWKRKNIHVINQTENMLNQSLHIRLKPLSVLPPGFVVKLVVSTVEADSSAGNLNMHTIASSGEAIDLFLSRQQLINVSASVFAKVVLEDTAYYRIKSVKNGPKFDYLLSMQWMGCFYWNKHNKDWASDGCQLMEERTDKMIFCRCNHLTAFSGAFLRPPNSLKTQDLRDNEKFKRSPLTLILVICILALYLLLLGFCVRADRYDKKKLGVIYLDDNTIASSMPQRLQISVQTGHWFGAGTSAGVYLIIHGDDHISDPIELKCAGKPLFQRSSCDVFVASIPKIFSNNIWKIHVWHDNKGEYPSWFLERIIIKDVNIGLKWTFDCNRWLAVDEEDGKVECELLPNTRPSITVKKSFSQHSAKSFVDYHLWFSLFGRPSYSRFTRVQRLSCCLSLLLSFLCVNIAWYHPRTEVHEVLGMLDISVESILVGVLCSIIVLPINLLWIFLFRYSRRSFRHRVKVYPVSERATDVTELAPSSASVLDQSLETVLILKNIGERRRWFQEAQQIDGVGDESLLGHPGDSLMRHPGELVECSSDGTSLGYISGHDNLGADPTLPNASAGLVETCDFLAALAPSRKKHAVEFDKQSTYSVCVSTSASEGRGPYRSGVSLPHIFVYVAWFGCLTTTAVASLFTIWYGVSFGWDLSIHWLQSLLFSLLESLLFSQPILVLLFVFYMACKSQTKQESEEGDEGFEDLSSSALHEIHYGHLNQGFEEEAIRDEVDPALALRRKQRHLKYLKPPSKSKLAEAREKRVRTKALWDYTVDLMVFIMFLVVTCLLVASVTSPDVYHLNQAIKKTFVTSNYSTPTNNIVDAWEKISATLNKNSGLPSYTPFTILLHDTQSLLFGRTKITQYKTPFVTVCHEIPVISGNQTVNVNNRFSGNASTGLCHAGEGAWISMELNQTRAESLKQLKHITDSQWINACTREISVEFAIYTPFLRAISAATLSVKASLTGTPKCQLELNTFPVFFKSAGYGYFVTVCKLLFVGIFLYLLQHEFFLALKLSTNYFSNFWRVFQLLIVALSSACLVLFIRWSISLYALLREVETTSQTHVFYYAKLVSWSQEALLVSYSLLLFLLVVRSLYLWRPFRFVVRLGRVLAAAVVPLLACGVVIVIVVMVFAHPGYLLFGRLHSSFKSFGEACLLVSSFFRLKGVSRFQEPALEEHPVLFSFYFALFLVGFCVVMRGTTAAVFVYGMPHFRKRRNSLLSNVLEEFIRNKLHLLKKKTRRQQRRDYTSDEDEDGEEDEEVFEEFEEYEELEGDSSFPMEHVLDELDDQIEEMTWRVRTLFGSGSLDNLYSSDDLLSCLSLEDSEDDVEYLYRADRQSLSSGSGYESDHSNMSPAKWQFSSSSSHDISDEGSRLDQYSRPPTFALGGAEVHGLGQSSCSSVLTVHPCEGELTRFDGTSRRKGCFVNDSASPVMCTEHMIGMDRELWDVTGSCGGRNVLRDIVMRDSDLHEGVLRDRYGGDCSTVSSAKAASQELSSSSGYSFRVRSRPDKEPIKPKAMYGVTRGHSLKGSTAFPELPSLSPRPSTCGEGSNSEGETNSSPKLEAGVRTTRSHSRKGKSLFRSSAVYPCQEGLRLGRSPPLPHRAANQAESGSDSGVQSAWGLAPSISERGFSMNRDPDGLISDISMNRRLGTEIRNETNDLDTPNTSV